MASEDRAAETVPLPSAIPDGAGAPPAAVELRAAHELAAAAEMQPQVGPEGAIGLERLMFFSDAVFAIAITLLVIDLRLPALPPHATNDQLVDALRAVAPGVAAYALSFTVVGLYWLGHWRRFHYVVRADQRLAMTNLLLLGLVAFIPFPTAVMGEHGDLPAAVLLYAGTLALAGLASLLTWIYAARAGLTAPGVTPAIVRYGTIRGLAVPLVMAGSLVLLPIGGTSLAEYSWLAIFIVQPLLTRRFRPPGEIARGL